MTEKIKTVLAKPRAGFVHIEKRGERYGRSPLMELLPMWIACNRIAKRKLKRHWMECPK